MTVFENKRFLLVALLCLVAVSCNGNSVDAEEAKAPLQQPEAWQNDLVAWLTSKPNGYFSDKVLWTHTDMGYNMHAATPIKKDETILIIPQAAIIHSDDTRDECVTISKMMKEYEKGDSSDYYPYIRYLFGGHDGGTSPKLLPTTWSPPAKDLLKTMLGSDLQPLYFEIEGYTQVLQSCADFIPMEDTMDTTSQQRWKDAYIFWLSRSWGDKMIPVLDMINHRNGKWKNVESTTAHAGEDIRVYAVRDIDQGEQLWNTYNECLDEDCQYGAIKYTYVTPNILMDYGFVEGYPRRFTFEVDEQGLEIEEREFLTVEIDEDPHTTVNKQHPIVLDWHYRIPTLAQLAWISKQLKRLEALEEYMNKGLSELTSEHEKNTIETYYNAYKEALELALKHKDDEVSRKTTVVRDSDEDEDDIEEENYDSDEEEEEEEESDEEEEEHDEL